MLINVSPQHGWVNLHQSTPGTKRESYNFVLINVYTHFDVVFLEPDKSGRTYIRRCCDELLRPCFCNREIVTRRVPGTFTGTALHRRRLSLDFASSDADKHRVSYIHQRTTVVVGTIPRLCVGASPRFTPFDKIDVSVA